MPDTDNSSLHEHDDEIPRANGRPPDPEAIPRVLPPPRNPMAVARELLAAEFSDGGALRWHRGSFFRWDGTAWPTEDDAAVTGLLYRVTERALFDGPRGAEPWTPTRGKIADLREALGIGVLQLPAGLEPPFWIGEEQEERGLIPMRNCLLDCRTRATLEHSADFFNLWSLPYDYDPDAAKPRRWLKFLHQLWPDDPDSIEVLQEWIGYLLSGDTTQQKIMMLYGAKRSGKGTILRVITALLGRQNVVSPTLSSLIKTFGLQPLIGKPLAIIADARFGGPGAEVVVERLLSISGDDAITVDRKNIASWTGNLPTRIMISANELLNLRDAAGALATRFLPLHLTRSWLGKENTHLTEELLEELPGILLWALDGLDRLHKNGCFTVTEAEEETIGDMARMASPELAFVEDCCTISPDGEEAPQELYTAFKHWCQRQGREHVVTLDVFCRNLRAAVPSIKKVRPWASEGPRPAYYHGITLVKGPHATVRGQSRFQSGVRF